MVYRGGFFFFFFSNPSGINGEWGGRPYKDLENCFEYVKEHMPFVDTENAIAAGASYGGYMALWIQGNPLGRKFKAIVCHDGVFSMKTGYLS
jgi:dipeptidyl aminopeptidase/acylaminoacyl peptidase